MTVIARDGVASDHLVYSWPFPIGPECEVACGEDEQVVMCPAWMVGDRLGPGHHHWRTPDPMRPAGAFFVRVSPVEATFDMTTSFVIPSTGQPVRIRAVGTLQIRCTDPGLLIAQFVGLPFDNVNNGVLRSVSRSIERMLARLLTRRVVLGASPVAVTDPGMLPGILEELVAYNPAAGAVFGIELIRMGTVVIAADDGSAPYVALPAVQSPAGSNPRIPISNGSSSPEISLTETARGRPGPDQASASGEIRQKTDRHASVPPADRPSSVSGEIVLRPSPLPTPVPAPPQIPKNPPGPAVEMPRSADDITQPGVRTPIPGSMRIGTPPTGVPIVSALNSAIVDDSRGSIMGIGMSHIGSSAVAGEIPTKVPPGGRVLVPGPNGLMQSATVRQLLQGYYELEVGSSGETIWVPINGVVPES